MTTELLRGAAGPPFGGVPGSAGFLFFGSLAVNSKRLSRANHGAGPKMPATSIAHTPVAITMQRLVIFIGHTSCLILLLQNTIRYPVTEVYHDHALNSSTCRTTELTGAGGPARPHWQLTWPARVRSSALVRHCWVNVRPLHGNICYQRSLAQGRTPGRAKQVELDS